MIEQLTVGYVEEGTTQRGGPLYKTKAGDGSGLFCFDAKIGQSLKASEGQTVSVDVDRSPNAQGKVFPTIKGFHGPATGGVPVAGGPAAAPHSFQAGSSGGAKSFSKDPAGIVLGARQTALNATVAFVGGGNTAAAYSPADVVKLAGEFAAFLLDGLQAAEIVKPAKGVTIGDQDIPF